MPFSGWSDLHPIFAHRAQRLCAETGLDPTSGYRSEDRQQFLYNCHANCQPVCQGNCAPANLPGTSYHDAEEHTPEGLVIPRGLAIDADPVPGGTRDAAHARAREFGLWFAIYELTGGEPWHCVDEETEILSAAGWKTDQSVAVGDQVMTLNPTTMLAEWQPVLAVIRQPSQRRRMLSMEGQTHSSLTTEEHRWLVLRQSYVAGTAESRQRRGPRVSTFRTSGAGFGAEDQIPLCAPVVGLSEVPKYADSLVALVAWYWTEGTDYNSSQVILYQSETVNADHVVRIRRALTDVFGPPVPTLRPGRFLIEPAWREDAYPRARGRRTAVEVDVHFTLNSAAGRILRELAPSRVPSLEFIHSLTEAQLRLFLDVSVFGDGCNSETRTLGQKRKLPLDILQMVAAMLGIPTHLRNRATTLSLLKSPVARPAFFKKQWVDHDGPVWCVTTPNGTWFARRHGTTYFTGNCQPVECTGQYRVRGAPLPVLSLEWGGPTRRWFDDDDR